MPAQPLTLLEREEIRAGIERHETDGEIGARLGRHRCSINAEINRNGGRSVYSATTAQARAEEQRGRPKTPKLVADYELATHVARRLKAKDSPMTISRELASGVHGVTGSLSHESIYQAVYAHGRRGLPRGLHEGLHRRRRCRKQRLPAGSATPSKPSPLGAFNLIGLRPPVADERVEVGTSKVISSAPTTVPRSRRCSTGPAGTCGSPSFPTAPTAPPRPSPRSSRSASGSPNRCAEPSPGTKDARWPATPSSLSCAASTCTSPSPTRPGNDPPTRTATASSAATSARAPTSTSTQATTSAPSSTAPNTMPRRSLHWSTAHDVYHAAVAMTGRTRRASQPKPAFGDSVRFTGWSVLQSQGLEVGGARSSESSRPCASSHRRHQARCPD